LRKSFLMLLLASGCGSSGDAENGAAVYDTTCAVCHGASGDEMLENPTANDTPAAKLSEEVPGTSDDELIDVILNGKGDMPAVDITETEAEDVVAYLRDTFGD
jgi:mono/diheme cytochrome c family protein